MIKKTTGTVSHPISGIDEIVCNVIVSEDKDHVIVEVLKWSKHSEIILFDIRPSKALVFRSKEDDKGLDDMSVYPAKIITRDFGLWNINIQIPEGRLFLVLSCG